MAVSSLTTGLDALTIRDDSHPRLEYEYLVANIDTFRGLKSLKIERIISSRELYDLVGAIPNVEELDVHVRLLQSFGLDRFERCPRLKSLVLRVCQATVGYTHEISAFGNPEQLRDLQAVCLSTATLTKGVIDSLSRLPLVSLTLESCTLAPYESILPLGRVSTLVRITLPQLVVKHSYCRHASGQIHILSKQLPQATIYPRSDLVDLTDYATVFTEEVESIFSYSLDQIRAGKWDEEKLRDHFYHEDNHLDRYFMLKDASTWTHNVCKLTDASAILSPTARTRYAVSEPDTARGACAFWRFVMDTNITVIAMVKELEGFRYFPYEQGQWELFIDESGNKVLVTCEKKEQKIDGCITTRTLRVNDKLVTHMQVNWPGFRGLHVDLLNPFAEEFFRQEHAHNGASLVHCMAGVGRTGTFLACVIAVELLKQKKRGIPLYFNPFTLLKALRQQRDSMIEKPPQLLNILEYLQKFLNDTVVRG